MLTLVKEFDVLEHTRQASFATSVSTWVPGAISRGEADSVCTWCRRANRRRGEAASAVGAVCKNVQ